MTLHLHTARSVRTADGILGDSILVEDGLVVAVGEADALRGDSVEVGHGDTVLMPGLRDAHLHPVAYAAALRGTTLYTAVNFEELNARLRTAADSVGPSSPVLGMRLNEETLAEQRLPDRWVLDAGIADRPVLAHRYCGHVAIANSAALNLAGVDETTPDPTGGLIDRDNNGLPTGVLRETAIELVADNLGGDNQATAAELLGALGRLASVGITSIGAILRPGAGAWASLGNEVDIALEASDQIPIKVGAYVIEETVEAVGLTKARIDTSSGRLRWLGIKRFGDGSFGGHTAAMDEPFIDVDTRGTMRLAKIDLAITRASLALGGGAAIHAIGDAASSAVIDMFETLIGEGADPGKLRIEHASVLRPNDFGRLAACGAIAVVQPAFLGSEAEWLGNRLGAERISRTYAFRSMDEAGVTMAGSSDSPVEPPDPWAGMALAQDRAGLELGQSISAQLALAMYTNGGAVALGEPKPLAVGSPADFLVVDRDPVLVSPDELRQTNVIRTYVDGVSVVVDENKPLWLE
ncbi:MAG: amidohydrolase [Acidimicrobiia bacterium]|nr:amidohydrolase [Acidimicrobiia bacterium]